MRAYTANMIPGGTTPTINVSQYDNDYAVTVTLIEGAEIYTPPVGATIRVEGTKPDGHGFEYPCTYQGNVVTMPIYTQMTVVSGRFPIELVVYQSGLRVGSCNIIFAVEKAPLGEDTDISETVIPAIIDAAQSSAEAAQEAAEQAQEAAAEVLSSQIVTEASGSVAAFPDGADDVAIKSMTATITPVQSGSGDPSPTNIRPISGRTGLTVTRIRNILGDVTWVDNSAISAQGVISTNNGLRYSSLVPVVIGESYAFLYDNIAGTNYNTRIHGYDSTGAWVQQIVVSSTGNNTGRFRADFTIPSGISYIRVSTGMESGIHAIALGATTNYPVTWETEAGTIYGGTLDVVSGVLTVTHKEITLDGDTNKFTNKGSASAYDEFYFTTSDGYTFGKVGAYVFGAELANSGYLCSAFALAPSASAVGDYAIAYIGSAGTLQPRIRFTLDRSLDTLAKANEYIAQLYAANTPVQIVYKLATPQTYQLTPTEVRTLLGGNTIYTDAGAVSVEYVADTKLYIDNKIAELQALVLEN